MAEVKILIPGYTTADAKSAVPDDIERSCATVSLILDGDIKMVVDPGVLEDQKLLVDALKREGLKISDITHVGLTHSHPDHYINAGMFPEAKFVEFFGVWHRNTVVDREENFSKNIKIIETPGHDRTGITFLVETEKGRVAVAGDVFWKENFPEDDPYADDLAKLKESRAKLLKIADYIVPGHANIYQVKR